MNLFVRRAETNGRKTKNCPLLQRKYKLSNASEYMIYSRFDPANLQNIPKELSEIEAWVCWREDPPSTKGSKPRKTPVNTQTLRNTDATDSANWTTQKLAIASCKKNNLTGIGFCLSENDPYTGIDLDTCCDEDSGELEPWAMELVRLIDSYTEISPSRQGVKIYIKGKLLGKKSHFEFKGHEVEVYDHGRYLAVTGARLENTSPAIWDRQKTLDSLLPDEARPNGKEAPRVDDSINKSVDAIADEEITRLIERSAQGKKFMELMAGSTVGYAGYFASSGALCTILASWTRCNRERIDRIYRTSGLYEEIWWDERCYSGGRTRGEVTVTEACALAAGSWQYDPNANVVSLSIECISAASIEPEPLSWLWENRIPLGKLTVFCGMPDTGKSTVAINIVASSTTGQPWPDGENSNKPFDVLMLISEDDLNDTIVPRLMVAGADLARVRFAKQTIMTGKEGKRAFRRIALNEDLGAIKNVLAQHPDIRLIVIDPLGSYLGKLKKNSEEDIRLVLSDVKELAEETKVSVISIDHFNKNMEQSGIHRLSGAGALAAVPRAVWAFVKDSEDPEKLTRLMLNAKLNVVAEAKKVGLAYRSAGVELTIREHVVSLPIIKWLGMNGSDLDEVLHKEKDREGGKINKCSTWLAEKLAKGSVFSREIYSMGAEAGFPEKTIRRAGASIGVQAVKTPGGWRMELKGAEDEEL